MATINGTGGNDTIRTTAAGGSLGGLPDATNTGDLINGLGGDDTIVGGSGNDTIDGGDGVDLIRGGEGDDVLRIGANANAPLSDVAFGEGGNDDITGVTAPSNFAFLFGGTGNDTIRGLGAALNLADYADRALPVVANLGLGTAVVGGTETDSLIGVRGIRTGNGDDQITGSSENDIILPGLGNNIAHAGAGFDRISYAGLAAGVTVDLAAQSATKSGDGSTDTITGFEVIQGTNHADTLRGDGLDNELRGLGGADVLDGRGGHDTVSYASFLTPQVGNVIFADPFTLTGSGVVVNLANGTATDNWGAPDTLASIESVIGSSLADDLTGIVLAGGERSFLRGLAGNDTLRGANATDTSITADYQGAPGPVLANLSDFAITLNGVNLAARTVRDGDGDTDTLIDIQSLRGSAHADNLFGSARNDRLDGSGGNDFLNGGDGNDDLRGGDGDDGFLGGSGTDSFRGGAGNDRIFFADFGITQGVTVNLTTGFVRDGFGNIESIPDLDIEMVSGTDFADDLTGLALAAGTIRFIEGRGGDDRLASPAAGVRVEAFYRGDPNAVRINLSAQSAVLGGVTVAALTARDGFGGTDTLVNILQVSGSNLGDTILGGDAGESLFGSSGNDLLQGGGGTDTLNGDDGDDTLEGGAGDDELSGGRGSDTYRGGSGYDIVRFQGDPSPTQGVTVDLGTGAVVDGYGNAETIPDLDIEMVIGAALADTLTGKVLPDGTRVQLRGREGNDTLIAPTVDTQVTADYRHGNAGTGVRVNLSDADATLGGQLIAARRALDGLGGTDTLVNIQYVRGGDFGDVILGSARNDRLDGEGGNDEIAGGAGNDTLRGQAGNDTLQGGDGNDVLYGGQGTDSYAGGAGYDFLRFNEENDGPNGVTVNLLTGSVVDPYGNAETILLADIEAVVGTSKADRLTGTNAVTFFAPGVQNLNFLRGLGGNDTLVAGAKTDLISASYEDEARPVIVNFDEQWAEVQVLAGEAQNRDTLINIAFARGTNFDDAFIGSADDDFMEGRAGNDVLDGRGGSDTATFFNAPAGIQADLALTGANVQDGYGTADTLIDVENVIGSNNAGDTILGNALANRLRGRAGNDTLGGRAGDDRLEGGEGNDELQGGEGDDVLIGDAGDDVAVYAGPRADYRVTENNGVFTVEDRNPANGNEGTDTLTAMERVRFSDGTFPVLALLQNGSVDAADDVFSIDPGDSINLAGPGLLLNDSDADNDPLTVTGGTQGTKGTASYGPDGGFSYTPNPGAIGTDTLYYTVSDGRGSLDVATITINIANQAPVAGDDAFTITQGGFLNVLPPGLLGNDTDPDLHTLRIDAIVQGPANGFINWTPQGRLFYEPFKPFSGVETLVYRVTDGFGGFDTGSVTITVTPIPNPPPAPVGPAFPTFTQAYADPHLVTLDGLAYDFMAVGEFVAVRAVAGDPIDVQMRTKAVGEVVSSISGIAVGIGGARVTVSADAPATLRIDGVVTVIDPAVGPVAAGGGFVFFDGQTYTVQYPNNELVRITDRGDFLDLSVVVSGARPPGQLSGLLGNLDGDPLNDLALPDGTVLAQPVAFDELYGAFADGWRVTDASSLFDYGPGETTATYTDLDFPAAAVSLADLPADLVALASAAVAAAGVTDPAHIEGDAGSTPVAFTLWRTGDLTAPAALDWSVVFSTADVDDLAPGTPLGGTVNLASGEASATVTLAVLGDTAFEPDERFAVTVTGAPAGFTVAAPSAPVLIVNDDAAPNPPPSALPDSYTLARGRVSEIPALLGLGANDTDDGPLAFTLLAGPAAGTGSVVVNADGSFTYTAAAGFVGLTGFSYTATDTGGLSASATVAITVEERAEALTGTDAADHIFGFGEADTISGLGGNDSLDGGDGADSLFGDGGNDTLQAGSGNDLLRGGGGNDLMEGGTGNDIYWVGEAGDVVVELPGGGYDIVRASISHTLGANVEELQMQVAGTTGTGNADGNRIRGSSGADTIDGGAGNDRIVGALGADELTGGAGRDIFLFRSFAESAPGASDLVTDFRRGQDRMDAREIDAFAFVGTGGFAGGGQASIRYEFAGSETLVQFDAGDGGAAEMVVRLTGNIALTGSDFLL